jgi:predicted membrane-bound dolichyl-phosphate-mannose-protein mannosyltransferase
MERLDGSLLGVMPIGFLDYNLLLCQFKSETMHYWDFIDIITWFAFKQFLGSSVYILFVRDLDPIQTSITAHPIETIGSSSFP